jgi:hypothetical protein
MEDTMIEETDALLDEIALESTMVATQSPEPIVMPSYPTLSQAERAFGGAASGSATGRKETPTRKCQVRAVTIEFPTYVPFFFP